MKKFLILFCFLLFTFQEIKCQSIYFTRHGKIEFISSAPLQTISSINEHVSSFIDLDKRTLVFRVPVRAFQFKRGLMHRQFNSKFMETDQYPEAVFRGKVLENYPVELTSEGSSEILVRGDLTIHGITHEIKVQGNINISDQKVTADARFTVNIEDYGIVVPNMLSENIARKVVIKVNTEYRPLSRTEITNYSLNQ